MEVCDEKKTQKLGASSFKFYKILKLQGFISDVAMIDSQSKSSKIRIMLNFL
jgi:ribosomal protein S8